MYTKSVLTWILVILVQPLMCNLNNVITNFTSVKLRSSFTVSSSSSSSSSSSFSCLTNHQNKVYKSLREFSLDMCAQCYHFMDISAFKSDYIRFGRKKWIYKAKKGILVSRSKPFDSQKVFRREKIKLADLDHMDLAHPEKDEILGMFKNLFYRVSSPTELIVIYLTNNGLIIKLNNYGDNLFYRTFFFVVVKMPSNAATKLFCT